MSSNCPPQLHLTLPANTTSFKRSFEQFGFDLEESPITSGVEPGGSSAGNRASGSAGNRNGRTGNERKRARSASSLSDGGESFSSSRSSSFTSSSDTSLSEDNVPTAEPSRSSSTRLVTTLVDTHPPRLPTPDISDIQDIEMLDYEEGPAADTNSTSSTNEYRFTIEAFHESDSEIEILQQSRSPHSRRLPTPPPTLPPLSLSEEEPPTDIPFLHSPTTAYQSIDIDRPSLASSTPLSHRENRRLGPSI
ncbi:MAG: hypothetical protein NXY57DRAFT_25176 [Lentinula lateritia]|nr:MAG: hypothetical protein NXY57DRAFT_25176 [Lentinula lateritia]